MLHFCVVCRRYFREETGKLLSEEPEETLEQVRAHDREVVACSEFGVCAGCGKGNL